jgi:hypothetical protein
LADLGRAAHHPGHGLVLTGAVLFPAGVAIGWLIREPAGGLGVPGTVFLAVYWTIALGAAVLMLLHTIKALVCHYIIGSRWNPRSRVWRFAMLNQWPDTAIAVALAVVVRLSH